MRCGSSCSVRRATARSDGCGFSPGVALASWVGTLVVSVRLTGGTGARVSLGVGWLFLLGAIAASFIAQSRAAANADAIADGGDRGGPIRFGASGAVALGLMICGLVLVGLAALLV